MYFIGGEENMIQRLKTISYKEELVKQSLNENQRKGFNKYSGRNYRTNQGQDMWD